MRDSDFDYPDTLPHEPLIRTHQTPHDIVGPFVHLLKVHLRKHAALKGATDKIQMPENELGKIAELYNDLRENGYYPLGLDHFGRIQLGIATNPMAPLFKNLDPVPEKITLEMIKAFNAKIAAGLVHGVGKTFADEVEERSLAA